MVRCVKFKTTVRLKRWTPALQWILECIDIAQNLYTWIPQLTITSINDSKHMSTSRHYTDEAVDLRSKNFDTIKDKAVFKNILLALLNENPEASTLNKFTVLFENEGESNEHFHIQVKKGNNYP